MKTRTLLIAVFLLGLTICMLPSVAGAFDPYNGVDCSGNNAKSAICSEDTTGNPISGEGGLLLKITNIIAYIAGGVAIIMILVGSIRFITSGSDISTGSRHDSDVEEARRTVVNALIGLAVIVLAKVIITYIVTRL